MVNKQIHQTKNIENKTDYKNLPKFITTFHPGLYKINGVIKNAFNILSSSPLTQNLFNKAPRVIFKRPANLKNILVKPKLPSDESIDRQNFKCEPCKKPRCKSCKILKSSNSFSSNVTKKTYPIVGRMSCHSHDVIYQLSCNFCSKDYIGQTTNPLHVRMNKNRSDTNLKIKSNPISAHAMEHNKTFDDCYSLQCINQIQNSNPLKLTNLEVAHQKVLKTKQPEGLNLRFG